MEGILILDIQKHNPNSTIQLLHPKFFTDEPINTQQSLKKLQKIYSFHL